MFRIKLRHGHGVTGDQFELIAVSEVERELRISNHERSAQEVITYIDLLRRDLDVAADEARKADKAGRKPG